MAVCFVRPKWDKAALAHAPLVKLISLLRPAPLKLIQSELKGGLTEYCSDVNMRHVRVCATGGQEKHEGRVGFGAEHRILSFCILNLLFFRAALVLCSDRKGNFHVRHYFELYINMNVCFSHFKDLTAFFQQLSRLWSCDIGMMHIVGQFERILAFSYQQMLDNSAICSLNSSVYHTRCVKA